MDLGESQQQGWQIIAIRMIGLLSVLLLLYVTGKLAFEYVPSLGLAPCEHRDGVTQTAHGLQAVLIAIGVWLQIRLFRRPSYASLIFVLVVPLAAWLIQCVTNDRDAFRQQQCAARPLAAAMRTCGANPNHHRLGRGQYGYAELTVTAPGTTDKAWLCLADWSYHNGKISLKVDESVYREYRKIHQ